MALLSISGLSKYYGIDEVFSQASGEVHAGERIGLVGPNGCGKSTLLKIVAGELESDDGEVHLVGQLRLGYLPQVPDFESTGTLWDAMKAVFSALQGQAAELRELEMRLASDLTVERTAVMERYGELLHRFEDGGGFTYEARIGQVLGGLGFSNAEFHTPVAHLSGGEKTRALLARLLLEEPDLLLLDEPTNHLDIAGIEWLEEQLQHWKGGIIVVAHDRAFLDAIVDHIWELEFRELEAYPGNYTAYTKLRAARRTRRLATYRRQQEQIAKTEDYISRNMAGQRSAQAKGRLKRLERLERLKRPQEQSRLHINLQTHIRSGDLVLGLYNLKAGYEDGETHLVALDEAEIHRGERVALVGPNGVGKTTLVRTILHDIELLQGTMRRGSAVQMGYFAQVQAHFDPDKSALETLLAAGMNSIYEARSFLAQYGFRAETVFKTMGVLSGGERARVALAILALQKANFLLLDEPTNHLDLTSQELLQEILANFNGTILMVSHDRYLIREIATHVWALDEGELHQFKGYAQYAAWHSLQREKASLSDRGAKEREQRAWEAQRQAERQRERTLSKHGARLTELEERIHQLETRLKNLNVALERAGRQQDIARVTKLGAEYQALEAQIAEQLEMWAEIADSSPV
ncbi:MAG: ATP-binding cassette domain-containing protein [Chloroflexota bacterium]|nr:ATP-binding cassette domain-containing protein [Chloroflexota bacterium]